jgi:hypothetical protein
MKSSSVYVDIIVTLWNISIFRCEPWLFIRMNWDSPWYPVVLVADGTIMYDVYSTLTKWAMGCEIPEFVSAACSPMFTSKLLKGVGCDKPVSMTIAVVFFWWGCEYWYSCWQTHTVNSSVVDVHFELCYWPARSFSRASRRCTSLFCHWVLIHGWLTLSVTFCQDDDVISGEFLTLPRCYTLYPYQLCLVPTHVVFVTIAI